MTTLAETISSALAAVGASAADRLHTIVAEFSGLPLGDDDRLTVLATAIAATAMTHHGRHTRVYLEAVRTWALEISTELQPGPLRWMPSSESAVDDGAEIIISGLDALIEAMIYHGIDVRDRLVTELALISQLLGQFDANTIHLTLMTVDRRLSSPGFRCGDRIELPLRDCALPLTREACLSGLEPRGFA